MRLLDAHPVDGLTDREIVAVDGQEDIGSGHDGVREVDRVRNRLDNPVESEPPRSERDAQTIPRIGTPTTSSRGDARHAAAYVGYGLVKLEGLPPTRRPTARSGALLKVCSTGLQPVDPEA